MCCQAWWGRGELNPYLSLPRAVSGGRDLRRRGQGCFGSAHELRCSAGVHDRLGLAVDVRRPGPTRHQSLATCHGHFDGPTALSPAKMPSATVVAGQRQPVTTALTASAQPGCDRWRRRHNRCHRHATYGSHSVLVSMWHAVQRRCRWSAGPVALNASPQSDSHALPTVGYSTLIR